MRERFWELPLEALDQEEWEALCDGCGKCCLIKLQDEDTNEIVYTRLACKLFDEKSCQCRDYEVRFMKVPDCLSLSLETIPENKSWLPKSCAYILRADEKPLPNWHYLLSGRKETIHEAGASVINITKSEEVMEKIEDAIAYIDRELGP